MKKSFDQAMALARIITFRAGDAPEDPYWKDKAGVAMEDSSLRPTKTCVGPIVACPFFGEFVDGAFYLTHSSKTTENTALKATAATSDISATPLDAVDGICRPLVRS